MKSLATIAVCIFILATPTVFGQHHIEMNVELNLENRVLHIQEEITYVNLSNDSLNSIVFNDWNNAYSGKNTPLAQRFSDEFYRGFHLAKEQERGATTNLTILDQDKLFLTWTRTAKNPDLITVQLKEKLDPKEKITLYITYQSKIPSAKFTKFGYSDANTFNLKNWFLSPARYENHAFVNYSNYNLDDIANGIFDLDIHFKIPKQLTLTTDLNELKKADSKFFKSYRLQGKNRTDFSLFIEPSSSFKNYRNGINEILTNIENIKVDEIQKNRIILRIANFANEFIGTYPHKKILISQADYDRNPFYGLNQLPSFINPFPEDFLFEVKFLKTYLDTFLKYSLHLDPRKDNWIYDALQMHAMIKYIEVFHPNAKMLGNASHFKLLKSYNITNLDFNEQYSYFYMLMARKNLDQALSLPKTDLIKFNEQIASKYRAGLSLGFLDDYLGKNSVSKSIHEFYSKNKENQVSNIDFENALKSNANTNIDWFFNVIINSRTLIDYKFAKVSNTQDSITFSIKNKNEIPVPIPIYGLKKDSIIFKKWLDLNECDSTFTLPRKEVDRIVLNYKKEVPEYNLRNNWKKLEGFFPNNRPIKFVFMKDLEDPYYNQILYVPILNYNFYDGLSPGFRFHNKTILEKPFVFDLNPAYSTKSHNFSGSGALVINQNFRNSSLFNAKYSLSGSYFHYAPDAIYTKIAPTAEFLIREPYLRDNRRQAVVFRQIIVNKEKSDFEKNKLSENYSVFNARYYNTKTELIHHFSFSSDVQFSKSFGKITSEIAYRKLFQNNRQINLRVFAGYFLYNNNTSDYYSFALDRPTDYLFDYNFYGRSESTGFFSQQYIQAEGGFKSKLGNPYANQWMTTINSSFNIWNWIELYGDVGLMKNNSQPVRFVYDTGVRFNLVPDYFELYFPVLSSNGLEINQKNYNEKIRFVVTFSPGTLINLFNRKWL